LQVRVRLESLTYDKDVRTMKDQTPFRMRATGFAAAAGIRAWMNTLDYQGLFYDRGVDATYASAHTRIYVFWHEYLLMPLALRGHCNLTMLLSKHRDADVLFRLAHHMGFECVRGSTYSGATAALMELSRVGKHMHMAITPDGPRGPRRELAQGPVFLASRLGLPIVCMGLGYDRPWRLKSWDRFAIPRPWSRARGIVGPEIYIPPNLDRDELELRRQGVERLLNELTREAESWATSGERRVGQFPVCRQGRILGPKGEWAGAASSAPGAALPSVAKELRLAG
jgi:lysophospholipid acyltransferase (LPLAT)-like uncharacterized protein